MKNINYKLLLVASTLMLLPQLVQAQNVESCNPTDCETLGYSRNSTDYCAKYLACPFDGSYKICTHICDDSYIKVAKKVVPLIVEKSGNSLIEANIIANLDASLTNDLGFSNSNFAELITAIGTEFNVTISASDAAQIKTVNDIIGYLGETCSAYPLTSCPSRAICESQYNITSCQSGYKLVPTVFGTNCTKTTTETTCSAGQYNNNGTCTACPAGTYSSASGSATSCFKCAVGSYQDQTGQTSCKTCATATTTGATSCVKEPSCPLLDTCPAGATCSVENKKYSIIRCDTGFTRKMTTVTVGGVSKSCATDCEPDCASSYTAAVNVLGCSMIKQYGARCYICCDNNSDQTINNGTKYHATYGATCTEYTGA